MTRPTRPVGSKFRMSVGYAKSGFFTCSGKSAKAIMPGKTSMKTARGVVTELPRSTRLGPGTGMWHRIPAGSETLRVHRRFFKDLDAADSVATPA